MKNCLQFGALLQSTCHFIVTYPAGCSNLRLLSGDAFSVCGGNSCVPSASHYLFFSGGNCKFPIFSQPNCKFGRTREIKHFRNVDRFLSNFIEVKQIK